MSPSIYMFNMRGRIDSGHIHVIADSFEEAAQMTGEEVYPIDSPSYMHRQLLEICSGNCPELPLPEHGWDRVHSYYSQAVMREVLEQAKQLYPHMAELIDEIDMAEFGDGSGYMEGYFYPRTFLDELDERYEISSSIYWLDAGYPLADSVTKRGIVHASYESL